MRELILDHLKLKTEDHQVWQDKLLKSWLANQLLGGSHKKSQSCVVCMTLTTEGSPLREDREDDS